MKYLLDTNVWIGLIRQNQPRIAARVGRGRRREIVLCSIVLAELLHGVEKSPPKLRATNVAQVASIRNRYRSLPFGSRAAAEYGPLRAYLESAGTPIGANDLMIASIALARGLIVVTHNTAEFGRVPNLAVEDWQ